MKRRAPTIFDELFPDSSPEFTAVVDAWPEHLVIQMLELVWDAFDRIKALPNFAKLDFSKDYVQLERSLTDLHMSEVTLLYAERRTGFESFIPQHEPWEFESLTSRSARPPSGDIGFVLRANRRLRWSVEAKVVQAPNDVFRYLEDLKKFLGGKSSPLSGSGSLAAYLVSGRSPDFLKALGTETKHAFATHPAFSSRAHRVTQHVRAKSVLPTSAPANFTCHHLVLALT